MTNVFHQLARVQVKTCFLYFFLQAFSAFVTFCHKKGLLNPISWSLATVVQFQHRTETLSSS